MSIQYDAIFLFQVGVGIAHMILGTLLFLNVLAFYYLGLGIYPAAVVGIAGLLIVIWVWGNKENNRSTIYLHFASADQITSYMQPLVTVIVLNAFLMSMAFYIYTLSPTSSFNSTFSALFFTIGGIMFAHAKVPPRTPKVKNDERTVSTPIVAESEHATYQSYNETMYNVGRHAMTYPNNYTNAKEMENRNITENAFAI